MIRFFVGLSMLVFFIIQSMALKAQVILDRSLVSSAGTSLKIGGLQADWSLGEVVVDQSDLQHPQGFHQVFLDFMDGTGNSVIHTVVSPNNDGLNDLLNVGEKGNQVDVMDRWGNIVFSQSDYQNDWSGTDKEGQNLPDGVYILLVRSPDDKLLRSGTLTIKTK